MSNGLVFHQLSGWANNAAKCEKALGGFIESRAVLTDPQNGWFTVFDEKSESQDIEVIRSLTKKLSLKLKTAVFAVMVHDSDIFVYLAYENGRLIDQFAGGDYGGLAGKRPCP